MEKKLDIEGKNSTNEYLFRSELLRSNDIGAATGGGETILNSSNKAKYDYILENKIAIRNQIKIIKFHSPKQQQQ